MTLSTVIYDDDDLPIYISAVLFKGMKASRDRWGVPNAPDDDDEVEITSATNEEGTEIELTEDQEEEALEQLQ